MEDIPNKIVTNLGIISPVNLLYKDGMPYIEIVVEPSAMAISYLSRDISLPFRLNKTRVERIGLTAIHVKEDGALVGRYHS